jgi:hypothetical protein
MGVSEKVIGSSGVPSHGTSAQVQSSCLENSSFSPEKRKQRKELISRWELFLAPIFFVPKISRGGTPEHRFRIHEGPRAKRWGRWSPFVGLY